MLPPPISTTRRSASTARPAVAPSSVSSPSFAMVEDVERDAGRVLDGGDDGPGVGGTPQGLRADERDPLGAEPRAAAA